eukprot:COSAG01_NODE_36923_length_510_cov_28.827251_1_plen_75_part_10
MGDVKPEGGGEPKADPNIVSIKVRGQVRLGTRGKGCPLDDAAPNGWHSTLTRLLNLCAPASQDGTEVFFKIKRKS